MVGIGCHINTKKVTFKLNSSEVVSARDSLNYYLAELAGHSSVYALDSLWVFGGFNSISVSDKLIRYNFTDNSWSHVVTQGFKPLGRYFHTVSFCANKTSY